MTQEEKELLLKDLCARLPYGIIVQQSAKYPEKYFMHSVADKWQTEPHDFRIIGVEGTNTLITDKLKEEKLYAKGVVSSPITICIYNNLTKQIAKPYLRPMSSMTEEERKELQEIAVALSYNKDDILIGTQINSFRQLDGVLDLFNSHHLDWRGLIEKGLALEALEGMYK